MSISSTQVRFADIRFQPAADALQAFTGCFWEITAQRDATIRVVPDGTASISIELQQGRSAAWYLRGPLLRPQERRFASPTRVVGVLLRPGVAYLLTGIPAKSLLDRRIDLGDVECFQGLVRADVRPPTPAQYIEALEHFLLAALKQAAVHDVVAAALREIERAHGCLTVGEVARRCRVSVRHLNRLMSVWVGYGAKRAASIMKFQATLNQMQRSPRESAASLASENGYFDQSHLTSDVGRFAGATPGRLASRDVADFSKTRCDDLP